MSDSVPACIRMQNKHNMKKSILFFLFIISITVNAFETNQVFGIKKQTDVNDYQQYVGQKFIFRPAYGTLETWNNSGISQAISDYKGIFTIKEIKIEDVTLKKRPNKKVTITARSSDYSYEVRFHGYQEEPLQVTGGKVCLISNMPIVFIEPFESLKKQLIGEGVGNAVVKDTCKIIDAFIGAPSDSKAATAELNVVVKNLRTGKRTTCPYSEREIAPFQKALKGHYFTSLIAVQKPDDPSDRYGNVKTVIEADNINKYSYNDSIIDIIIYSTPTQFHFVLRNVSNSSIKVIWEEGAFVRFDGISSKIMHAGTKYLDREKEQLPTIIIRGAAIEDVVVPTSNVYLGNTGWETSSMLPETYLGNKNHYVKLMLPVQIKDVVNEYTFVFKLNYVFDHPELIKSEETNTESPLPIKRL